MLKDIGQYTQDPNIARHLDDDELRDIGTTLHTLIQIDENSRAKWVEDYEKWLKLAEQVQDNKSYPWNGASNVKFPILTLGAIQFHARAFAALFSNRNIVQGKIYGQTSEEKRARARRVGDFMSVQFLDLMEDWQEDMDRLLMILPIVGLVYKKTYYSGVDEEPKSELVSALDVIVNYHAKSYERGRITHRIEQDSNEIYESVANDLYLDLDLGEPVVTEKRGALDEAQGRSMPPSTDDSTPYSMFECHCWLDLDDDGYKEPYIVTLHEHTQQVVRIVARWDRETDIKIRNNRIAKINPTNHFVAYKFLPDPESKTHGIGFGRLLGPTNAAVNTLINMMIDAGHMDSLGGGFLSKGIRIKGGTMRFRPQEWKSVPFMGDDIRKGIFPLPTKEPSRVLYDLLVLLLNSGKDLTSVQDIMVGRNPGQNQPHSTTQEVLEQGLKVFNGIYKRVYRSMTKEFHNVYRLNGIYPPGETYLDILDEAEADLIGDFSDDGFDVRPTAEPDMVRENNKIMRAHSLKEHLVQGFKLNPDLVTRQVLEAEGHENVDELMKVEPPPPSIEQQELELKKEEFKHKKMMETAELRLSVYQAKEKALKDRMATMAQMSKIEIQERGLTLQAHQTMMDAMHKEREAVINRIEAETSKIQEQVNLIEKANQAQQQKQTEGA